MLLNLKEWNTKDHTVQWKDKLDLSDFLKERQDLSKFGTLEADLEAASKDGIIEVAGTLTLPVTMLCSRCLTEIDEVLTIPFRERFTQRTELIPQDNEESEEEVHLVKEDRLDLRPYVEENVWMALPYIPLCSEACKGLCPTCGQNRNTDPCGCSQEKVDPRLAGLADFFNQNKE
ncbi:DUF177 domain-containing protein [Paenibacillus aurantius]|uniref:DUF177 domain-containing protein n=1 Tax=Paenibacillus aurantius TaxID=2918900 RepID=A0AA96RH60_9BACL|nr:DUF177 domain-containing protein [Paenibacillus aurantius]WJH33236.1 DUF177 domain-containing protein [Paenibacillus sp. CC-CFT747]WNQ13692.1 DUF177 domain-containing protein [Paenibacillus aurantius]